MTQSTITFNQGAIVLVPFPFTSLESDKKRPALVISSSWYNHSRPDYVMVAITSSIHSPISRDEILISGLELNGTGLIKESLIVAGKIFTIQKDKVIKQIGRINSNLFQRSLFSVVDVLTDQAKSATVSKSVSAV